MQTDGLKQVRELAKSMQGRIFADRETLADALNYAIEVASFQTAHGHAAAVYTAVHVVLNTAAKLIEKECNKEMEMLSTKKEVEYNPDPEQMACADRFNQAWFS